jgi:transposase InsO family protein
MELRDAIQKIALEMPAYGYRRVTAELRRQGRTVNHKRVLRIMREDNLLCLRRRKFVVTTDSNHKLPVYPNLARDLKITGLNQLWVADLTYIRLQYEFVFLAVILDAFSRKVIGWALERTLEATLTIGTLKMAIRCGRVQPGLVHHSDRGSRLLEASFTHDGRPKAGSRATWPRANFDDILHLCTPTGKLAELATEVMAQNLFVRKSFPNRRVGRLSDS